MHKEVLICANSLWEISPDNARLYEIAHGPSDITPYFCFLFFFVPPLSSNLVIANFHPLASSFLLHNHYESGMARANRCFLGDLTREASSCMPTGKRMPMSWSIYVFFDNSLIIPSKKKKKAWNFKIFRYDCVVKITWSCRFLRYTIGEFLAEETTWSVVYLTPRSRLVFLHVPLVPYQSQKNWPLYLNSKVKSLCVLWAIRTGQIDPQGTKIDPWLMLSCSLRMFDQSCPLLRLLFSL